MEYEVTAMFTSGQKAVYRISKNDTVGALIEKIKLDADISKPQGSTVNIIYSGRILQPSDVFSAPDDQFTVHVLFRKSNPQSPTTQAQAEPRGFDRLSRMNYTPEQIAEIRRQFHESMGTADQTEAARIETEEEWFPTIFNQENPLDMLGTGRLQLFTGDIGDITEFNEQESFWIQMIFGVIMGAIFGFVSLILILVYLDNRGLIMGLLAGVCLHYGVSYLFSSVV